MTPPVDVAEVAQLRLAMARRAEKRFEPGTMGWLFEIGQKLAAEQDLESAQALARELAGNSP